MKVIVIGRERLVLGNAVGNTGWLAVMFGIWALPVFTISLGSYGLIKYLSSYVIFVIPPVCFLVTTSLGAILFTDRFLDAWIKRMVYLTIVYNVSMVLSIVVIVWMQHMAWIKYFGGDAGGSVGLLFIPSGIVYLGIMCIIEAVHRIKRLSGNS